MTKVKKTAPKTKSGRVVTQRRTDTARAPADARPSAGKYVFEVITLIDGVVDEQQAAHHVKWTSRQIKASRARSERTSKRIERLSRETDAVLARLKIAR
jgi:hypothetical protein